ncbi:ribulokinase [Mongoliitalea lutea]|uniref:Ribulokinase n=1 Tax=Mongoliitalea lutea TaxID=849756 RepID=A0A8J3CX49_9BACT|nr:ribulokinase [Mongoliitalea lutea]GHB32148.1 ribulokinase [Mongoliitalea lutea]
MNNQFVIGLDYGSDSVRAVLVNVETGVTVASNVFWYPRWKQGLYCDPVKNQFRQHPLDHLEGLQTTITAVLKESGIDPKSVKAICVDTTGSSPMAVNEKGQSLAMTPEFAENPHAMMILWKDHTGIGEADEINRVARTWEGIDYTQFEGGIYSSEWFWAKILRTIRVDESVKNAAYSWMEHCDFITAQLIGCQNPLELKRSRCAAGHKAMWHESWGGLPSKEFLQLFDPYLADLRDRLYEQTYTSDTVAGNLSEDWAEILGLSTSVVVAVGTFDAHAGAVGAEISENTLMKVMGTSTCDIMVANKASLGEKLIPGICGQVDGSVIPGTIGLEAGQSAFGDVLAWFKKLLLEPSIELIQKSSAISDHEKAALIQELDDQLLVKLSEQALQIPVEESTIVALDWINGRRTPDANQALKGALRNLSMGSDAARIFKSLVESICFGSKSIVERFRQEGVAIDAVIGLGGVAKKSPLVMQTLADVLNMPIKVATSEQAPALGAAMYAAVAAGIYSNTQEAIQAMGSGFDNIYYPIPEHVEVYERLYQEYVSFGKFVEKG